MTKIHTLDLNFQGITGAIATYLIPHAHGAVLVESGPGSTVETLRAGLKEYGYDPEDITDVLLTHIHLDHGGAAGWMARKGARIHVHPVGAPHLINPEKLLVSATRIYGEMMDTLWGEFLPVPEDKLSILQGDEIIEIEGLCFQAIDTPGHAEHHYAYLLDGTLFTGDIGGVRVRNSRYLRLPMPPPEFNLEKWRLSLKKLEGLTFQRIAPTHYGIYQDPDWHLAAIARELDVIEAWMEAVQPQSKTIEELRQAFGQWSEQRFLDEGMDPSQLPVHDAANPAFMSADGIMRYWKKTRVS